MSLYRGSIVVFAILFVAIGFTTIVLTALRGGGIGLLFGALFVALGAGRLYLLRRGSSRP